MWISAFTPGLAALRLLACYYVAEFYLPGEADLADLAISARAGAEQAASSGAAVSFIEAIFVPADENCFALYQAASSADVADAGRRAGIVFDRVTAAERVVARISRS